MLTITQSARSWATVRWSREDTAGLMPYLIALAELPGTRVYVDGCMAEVPASAWFSSVWLECFVSRADNGWSAPRLDVSLWQSERPLFQHQRHGAAFLVGSGGGLLADQPGLGKTTTAIVAAETIARAENPRAARLIIAPGFTREVWRRELLATGAISNPSEFCAVKSRNPYDASFRPTEASWWFVHYDVAEAWASRLVTNARGRPVVAIVDEAHWIKNGRASRSKGTAAAAGTAVSRILLTGTPVANRPSELWHLLSVLDGATSWGSPVEFRQRYCGAHHDGYGWVDGLLPTNVDELQDRLERNYLRRTVDDAGIELPAFSRTVITADLADSDRHDHVEIIESLGGISTLLAAFERGAYGREVLRALSKLAKLTSAAKLRTTVDHVASLVDQDEAVVVFVHERATAAKIERMLDVEGVASRVWVATGEQSQSERDEIVARFQAGERDVLVTTYGAMREGVTLDRARNIVLHDLSWVPSDVIQAEKRIHRLSQRRSCVSTWVLAEDSFDTILARVILEKGRAIEAVVGDAAASAAAADVGLARFAGPSIEEEAERLLDAWTTI